MESLEQPVSDEACLKLSLSYLGPQQIPQTACFRLSSPPSPEIWYLLRPFNALQCFPFKALLKLTALLPT